MNGRLNKVCYIIKRQGLGLVITNYCTLSAGISKVCCKSTQVHHL